MTMRDQAGRVSPGGGQGAWWTSPVVVLPVLALIANAGVYLLATKGVSFIVPIELIGGFAYRFDPSVPVLEALILAFGLWCWSNLSTASAFVAAVVLFVLRVAVAFLWGYLMSKVMPLLPDAVLTMPTSFYGPLFLATAVTGASLLLVLAIYEPAFRAWWPWIVTLLIWAGGATWLFELYHDQFITRLSYHWLYEIVRALGFIPIGYAFRRPLRHFH
ncbi:MAG TPA: hypothetical protein VMU87_01490 [Stellaceae bacterium]|nr:hypothetical protein [Stellaceae bacterium]